LKLDDLIGIFFLLAFVVLPVVRSLLVGEEPKAPEPEAQPPGEPEPRPAAEPPPQAPPEPSPVAAAPEPPRVGEPGERRGRKSPLALGKGAILKGIIWHEVLSEPRGRRRWRPKP